MPARSWPAQAPAVTTRWAAWWVCEGVVTVTPLALFLASMAHLRLVTLGVLLLVRTTQLGFADTLVWPVAVLATGFVIAATRTDLDVAAASGVTGRGSTAWVATRILAGVALAVAGVVGLFAFNIELGAARDLVLGAAVVSLGLTLVLGPWVWRVATDLLEERRRRIRSEERTELAAECEADHHGRCQKRVSLRDPAPVRSGALKSADC